MLHCTSALLCSHISFHGPLYSYYSCCIAGRASWLHSGSAIAMERHRHRSGNSEGQVHKEESEEEEGLLLMFLSPTKTLDVTPFVPPFDTLSTSAPSCDPCKTRQIAVAIKEKSERELMKLFKISTKVAATAHQYWSCFKLDDESLSNTNTSATNNNVDMRDKPAIFMYSGPSYQSLNPITCSIDSITYLQHHLRIIDALYGILRPLDIIQPYRLDMSSPCSSVFLSKDDTTAKSKLHLSSWWKASITLHLCREVDTMLQNHISNRNIKYNNNYSINNRKNQKIKISIINLASDEFWSAINVSSLFTDINTKSSNNDQHEIQIVKIIFQTNNRVISTHSKNARGLMVRYIADHCLCNVNDIKLFDWEGYKYDSSKSIDQEEELEEDRRQEQGRKDLLLVFNRPQQQPGARRRQVNDKDTIAKKGNPVMDKKRKAA